MGSNKVWYEFLEHLADGLAGLFLGPESDGLQTVLSSRKLDTPVVQSTQKPCL